MSGRSTKSILYAIRTFFTDGEVACVSFSVSKLTTPQLSNCHEGRAPRLIDRVLGQPTQCLEAGRQTIKSRL